MRADGTSAVLEKGMEFTLDAFRHRHNGERDIFYWVLRLKLAELNGGTEGKTRTIPAAIAALQQGRHSEHDRLIAAAAADVGPCDALVLGQFSMARAAAGIPAAPGRKVLTSPHSAVARLKQLFANG